MRGRFAILSLSVVLATLGSVGVAHADPPGSEALPIHVVSVRTDDADDQAEALTQAIKSEVRKLKGWSLGEGDHSLEVLSLALRCPTPPDAACEVRIADQIKASRFIWGTLKKTAGKRVSGTLHLWTRDQGQTKTDISFSDNLTEPNDETLRKLVTDALATLTGGPPKGSVKITAGEVDGQIFVDGEPSGSIKNGQATIFVAVGSHKIEVRAPGYATASGEVTVRPNSSVGLTLTPQTEEQAGTGGGGTNWRKITGYSALAAGAIFAGVGAYSGIQILTTKSSSEFDGYKKYTDGDLCKAAAATRNTPDDPSNKNTEGRQNAAVALDDKCQSNDKFVTLQYIFYPLAAVAAGAGLYLLLTDKPKTEKTPPAAGKVRFFPSFRPNGTGGNLDVVVTF